MKKLFSLLLALIFLMSVLALFPVFADESEPVGVSSPNAYLSTLIYERIYVKSDTIRLVNAPTDNEEEAQVFENTKNAMFDGDAVNTGEKFEGRFNDPGEKLILSWQTEALTTVANYMVYTGSDSSLYPVRNPDGWVLYGSSDGFTYHVIDRVENAGLENLDNYGYFFTVDTPAAYRYYKIEIGKNVSEHFQLNEIEFYSDLPTMPDLVEETGEYRYPVSVESASCRLNCGFIDGDMYFGKYGLSRLFGTEDSKEILGNTRVFVNGVEARFSNGYLGYVHSARNRGDGLLLGIVGAGYDKSQPITITLLMGEYYYATYTYPALTEEEQKNASSALAVVSSDTVYHSAKKTCVSSVTFSDPTDFEVGGKISARLHDDHNDRTFMVTAVSEDRKTVTFFCDNMVTTKSLLEFKVSDDLRFSVAVDSAINTVTETAVGYIQTREHKEDPEGRFDARIIIEANENYIKNFSSATLSMDFTLADGSTRAFSNSNTTLYREVQSGDDIYTATKDCALFGVAVIGVPMGTRSVSVKVTFRNAESGEETEINIGTASLAITTGCEVSDVKDMNCYDSGNITVTEADDGRQLTDDEGALKLFDGTTNKHGTHKSEFSVSFTTREAITLSGIIFTIANDTYTSGASRTYRAWTLYGQDETGRWWEVASSTRAITTGTGKVEDGVDPDTVADSNRQAYIINNAGEFSSYRLEIIGGGGYTQMAEITLYTAKSN